MREEANGVSMDWRDDIEGDHEEMHLFRAKRDKLTNAAGLSYSAFRKTLKANYSVVWATIAAAWAVLILCAAILVWIDLPAEWLIPVGVAGGIIIGYTLAFLSLWFHEASHYNIHPDRRMNDRLANLFIGPAVGLCLSAYRPVHFGHHARLGKTDDPERSYFSALTSGFIARTLFGSHVLAVLRNYANHNARKSERTDKQAPANWMFPISLTLHLGVPLAALLLGHPALTIGWFVGAFMAYPCIGALRQLLEHRRFDADNSADYTVIPHGAFSRVFGSGPVASTLGGAGFNRHLIHHWDPALSCTVFKEVEDFLLDSELAAFYRRRQSTYGTAFRTLFRVSTKSAP